MVTEVFAVFIVYNRLEKAVEDKDTNLLKL